MTTPRSWRTWLRPGMHVKRWAALFLLGTILTGLSIAMGLVYSYRYVAFPEPVSSLVQILTLQFLPREFRFALVFSVGIAFMAMGFYRLSGGWFLRSSPTSRPTSNSSRSSPSIGSASRRRTSTSSPLAAAPGSPRCFAASSGTTSTSPRS